MLPLRRGDEAGYVDYEWRDGEYVDFVGWMSTGIFGLLEQSLLWFSTLSGSLEDADDQGNEKESHGSQTKHL